MDKQKQKADVIKKGKYMENMAMSVKNEQRLGRAAGILLPVSSLPSKYGIGTFGDEAYEFVDALVEAGQKFWQVLPLGPTSYGDSPYQSFSLLSELVSQQLALLHAFLLLNNLYNHLRIA